jgi:hypothetical protein
MTWTYNKNHVTKDNLGLLDILAHNNWKRPIYFAITVPSDNYAGLDKYLYKEGFAYRLLPLQASATTDRELLNTSTMYTNMMTKFRWGNMKNASYLDTETSRMMLILINNFNILAEQLLLEGKILEAKKTLDKCQEVMPDKLYAMNFAVRTYFTADLLYKVGETQKANALMSKICDYVRDEVRYFIAIEKDKPNAASNDIQLGLSILNEALKRAEIIMMQRVKEVIV